MALEQEIRSWLRRYLRNEISFAAFEDWFVDSTWDVQRTGTKTAQWLTYAIERRISEYTSNCKTETQLKRVLRPLAPSWWAIRRPPEPKLVFGAEPAAYVEREYSDGLLRPTEMEREYAAVDTQRAEAFA